MRVVVTHVLAALAVNETKMPTLPPAMHDLVLAVAHQYAAVWSFLAEPGQYLLTIAKVVVRPVHKALHKRHSITPVGGGDLAVRSPGALSSNRLGLPSQDATPPGEPFGGGCPGAVTLKRSSPSAQTATLLCAVEPIGSVLDSRETRQRGILIATIAARATGWPV
jgi:hypothetical protein